MFITQAERTADALAWTIEDDYGLSLNWIGNPYFAESIAVSEFFAGAHEIVESEDTRAQIVGCSL